MPAPPDSVLIGTHFDRGVAERFKTLARETDGTVAAALRRILISTVAGQRPREPLGTSGYRVTVRLKETERLALLEAARARQTTPSVWLRCLAIVHLGQRPQWNEQEVVELRAVFTELRRIGTNLNQIARALNVAVQSGEYPAAQGTAALEAADLVRSETRRVVGVMTGNFDYWGLPDADRPAAQYGAIARDQDATEDERRKAKLRPRRRPSRFADSFG
ncbi:MAG: plasmid mobilization relaxosome protein MobC [Janthinobacterium lividum]